MSDESFLDQNAEKIVFKNENLIDISEYKDSYTKLYQENFSLKLIIRKYENILSNLSKSDNKYDQILNELSELVNENIKLKEKLKRYNVPDSPPLEASKRKSSPKYSRNRRKDCFERPLLLPSMLSPPSKKYLDFEQMKTERIAEDTEKLFMQEKSIKSLQQYLHSEVLENDRLRRMNRELSINNNNMAEKLRNIDLKENSLIKKSELCRYQLIKDIFRSFVSELLVFFNINDKVMPDLDNIPESAAHKWINEVTFSIKDHLYLKDKLILHLKNNVLDNKKGTSSNEELLLLVYKTINSYNQQITSDFEKVKKNFARKKPLKNAF